MVTLLLESDDDEGLPLIEPRLQDLPLAHLRGTRMLESGDDEGLPLTEPRFPDLTQPDVKGAYL